MLSSYLQRWPTRFQELNVPLRPKHFFSLLTVVQITPDVDSDPRAAYFRQAKNGLFIRMAILKLCLQDSLHARQG